MQYFGGKHRIAGKLLEVIQPEVDRQGVYAEPFVGGASMMCRIVSPVRIGADVNESLITLWRKLAEGWTPPCVVTEEDYRRISARRDPTNPMTAFVGFGCSWGGKWFGGYARGAEKRNYAANAVNSLARKMVGLKDVRWVCSDYAHLGIPDRAVVYCDPPYQGTAGYGGTPDFDWSQFWDWCRWVGRERGRTIFVSEYAAPSDFTEVLSVETKTDVRNASGCKEHRVEKLFTI